MNLAIDDDRRPETRTSHDRLSVLRDANRTLIALADGADSGWGAQAAAAETVEELARCFRSGTLPDDPADWVMILEAIDHVVLRDRNAGETSALAMFVQRGVVVGASVGDSVAYMVPTVGEPELLTPRLRRSPQIGTGIAQPIGFGPAELKGRLITRPPSRVARVSVPPAAGGPKKHASF